MPGRKNLTNDMLVALVGKVLPNVYSLDIVNKLLEGNKKLAYYTSAAVAKSIIEKNELWLRNVRMMNDFSEVRYGLSSLYSAFDGAEGQIRHDRLKNTSEKFISSIGYFYSGGSDAQLVRDTYSVSLTLHDKSKEADGRLSMWRGYGGNSPIALIFNPSTFLKKSNSIFLSGPVRYPLISEIVAEIDTAIAILESSKEQLMDLGDQGIEKFAWMFIYAISLLTKDNAFHEEQEWRVYLSAQSAIQNELNFDVELIDGLPQKIYKYDIFGDFDEHGKRALLGDVLETVLIGPSPAAEVVGEAFVALLEQRGVPNPGERVRISNVPFRSRL